MQHLLSLLLAITFLTTFTIVGADVLDLKNFELRPNTNGKGLQDRADNLGKVLGAKASVKDIMSDLNRNGQVVQGKACNSGAVDNDKQPNIATSMINLYQEH